MKKEYQLVLLIFLVTLATRLFFAFQTPFFSHEAYFNIRQIEYITHNGKPFFYDELSYGGRYFIFPPLFQYALSLFSLILPVSFVAKVLPNIFASSLVFAVYLVAKRITKDRLASYFSAFVSGFLPIFFSKTINSISVYSLLLPLIFFAIYCLLKIKEDRRYLAGFIVLMFILPLTHQMAVLFLIGMVVYMLLAVAEGIPQDRAEFEVIIFSAFVIFWIQFLIYKQAFLQHGLSIIWQNIPITLLGKYFSELNVLQAIYQIGVVPFIFGIFVIYQHIFRKKSKDIYLLFGFALGAGLLLWLRLIQLELGLMFLGIILAILFSQFYKDFSIYLEKTKAAKYRRAIIAMFLVIFIFTSVFPSLSYANQAIKDSLTEKESLDMNWMRLNTKKNTVILASLTDSYVIEALANRKTVMDPNFLLIPNIEQRYSDFQTMLTTPYETDAIRLLNKYGVFYIYFSDNLKEEYGVEKPIYLSNKKCFDMIDENVNVYEASCEVEEE